MISDNGIAWDKHYETRDAENGGFVTEEHPGYIRLSCRICGGRYIHAIAAPNPDRTCGMSECLRVAEVTP